MIFYVTRNNGDVNSQVLDDSYVDTNDETAIHVNGQLKVD